MKPDVGRESHFLPTLPAFKAPLGCSMSEYCYNVWYGKARMVWLPDGYKNLKIRLLISTEYTKVMDRQIDKQMDRQTDRQMDKQTDTS